MAFTPGQRQRLEARTTPSSRQRLADKLKQKTGTAGQGKPGLDSKSFGGTKPAGKPGRSKPTPAASKPVSHSSQPDSAYYDSVDLAGRQGESRLGQLEGQEQAVRHDFGIEDPTNPNSRAEGLKRMYLQRFRGASAGIAAQGHLYSGQHERALSRTRRDEEEARADLRSNYEGMIGQIGAAKAGVKFDTEEQRIQAFEDWLARAPESEASGQAMVPGWGGGEVADSEVTPLPRTTPSTPSQNAGALSGLAGSSAGARGKAKPPKSPAKLKAAQKELEKQLKKPSAKGKTRGR